MRKALMVPALLLASLGSCTARSREEAPAVNLPAAASTATMPAGIQATLATERDLATIEFVAAEPQVTAEQIERDLTLVALRNSARVIPPGGRIDVSLELVNRSPARTYPVVKPGDGSEVGWREPHLYYTAQQLNAQGDWEEVPAELISRCGNYDAYWHDEVLLLPPGIGLPLSGWGHNAGFALELQRPGPVRLFAHYRYTGMPSGVDLFASREASGEVPGRLRDVPPFGLVSAPVELEIVCPLELRVSVQRPLQVGVRTKLSQVIAVVLTNVSAAPIEIASPSRGGKGRLELEITVGHPGWNWEWNDGETRQGEERMLSPGESVSLLGSEGFSNGMDGEWEDPTRGFARVRAIYRCYHWQPTSVIKSPWVEVPITPQQVAGRAAPK